MIRRAEVIHRPTGEELAGLYPADAQKQNVGGRAVVNCRILLSTRLSDCKVESESPPGRGFGEAAIKMALLLRVRPPSVDGEPVRGARLRYPVTFGAAGWTSTPTVPATSPTPAPRAQPLLPARTTGGLFLVGLFAAAMLLALPAAWFWPLRRAESG